jgi:hypothetical protein
MRLPSLEADEELGGRLGRHAVTCLRCQAEAARYRSLRRRLARLADETEAAPTDLIGGVIVSIGEPSLVDSGDRDIPRTAVAAAAAAGAVVAAAAAAGAAVVIGLRRSRAA